MQINVLVYSYTPLVQWSYVNLGTPYWRLYWNSNSGAFVRLKNKRYDLDPGRIFLIPPNTPLTCGLDKPVNHFYVHFTLSSSIASFPSAVHLPMPAKNLIRLARSIAGRVKNNRIRAVLDMRVQSLVAESLCALPEQIFLGRSIDARMAEVLRYLEGTSSALPQNDALAKMAGMSTGGFIRLFTKEVGVSPRAYALRKRIETACILLHHSELSIDVIAERCGFWDRNYFTRQFIKARAVSPGAYRKTKIT